MSVTCLANSARDGIEQTLEVGSYYSFSIGTHRNPPAFVTANYRFVNIRPTESLTKITPSSRLPDRAGL